jgi:hypothetical protein
LLFHFPANAGDLAGNSSYDWLKHDVGQKQRAASRRTCPLATHHRLYHKDSKEMHTKARSVLICAIYGTLSPEGARSHSPGVGLCVGLVPQEKYLRAMSDLARNAPT